MAQGPLLSSQQHIVKKSLISRQAILVTVFAVLVIFGGGYYYYITFAPQGAGLSLLDLQVGRQLSIKKVDWQKELYENPQLKNLHDPLTQPLSVGSLGNQYPFSAPQKTQ